MFGIFASPARKLRQSAAHWLELADKVLHFRRDILPAAEVAELQAQTAAVRRLLKEKAETAKLKLGLESLEEILRRTGGLHYPKSSLVENVEFFLVAAIVILGIRTYFVQPFKIPTNSMWPTYYGMTADNFPPETKPAPGLVAQGLRLAAFGAQRREVTAPRGGEVSADFISTSNGLTMAYTVKRGRNWFVIPTQVREYTFYVDGTPATVTVPLDFHDFDRVVVETFFGDRKGLSDHLRRLERSGKSVSHSTVTLNAQQGLRAQAYRLPLDRTVAAGDPIIRFDILTGDQLFVDRMSYHFVRPAVGQGFVFRTGQIPGIGQEQYYIKRLVGLPGDTLEIKNFTLYRNGAPITGSVAFEKNARQADSYVGYRNYRDLAEGRTMTVPPESYLALGDNSANSEDGRSWGYVPAKEAVGRPLFIYYPFTKRWGPAR
ncbi:MAG TPA: signal peptidase I [Opitutaceae bacterium]|nr:signal peptidase I [Opitutaceae bacterium]